jgi:DNA-binding transcriptional regulator YiaG
LRVSARGRPIRIFFAFDPRQSAIVLIGGDPRLYDRMVPSLRRSTKPILRKSRKNAMPRTKWTDVRRPLAPEREEAVREEVRSEVERMKLSDLRRARHLSQTTIAKILDMSQGDVSKLERRADMYVSTLRSFIEAVGGKLQIIARFPDGTSIEISTFHDIELRVDAEMQTASVSYGS